MGDRRSSDGHQAAAVTAWTVDAGAAERRDAVACEEPMEIRVEGRAVSVTMRTPGHDAELAVGFLASEGLIREPNDVVAVEPARAGATCNVWNVRLARGCDVDFDRLTRHVFASSSCGLCGKATIEALQTQFAPVRSALRLEPDVLLALPERLRDRQTTFARTGGLHAAAVFDASGALVVLREDVGRHNAVDKILGWGLRRSALPFDRHVLLVSGRTSFELVQKALVAGVPVLAAVSAPSSLAIDTARAGGITLVGFLRPGRMNVYAHPERLDLG